VLLHAPQPVVHRGPARALKPLIRQLTTAFATGACGVRMKGVVFAKFINMVEQRCTPEWMDEVIEAVAEPIPRSATTTTAKG
jgi:hypothetical protein